MKSSENKNFGDLSDWADVSNLCGNLSNSGDLSSWSDVSDMRGDFSDVVEFSYWDTFPSR